MNIKERRLRNSSKSVDVSHWTSPAKRNKQSDGFRVFLLVFGTAILLAFVISVGISSLASVTTNTAEEIILGAQYNEMSLETQGQATLKNGKLYIGNNTYTSPDQRFFSKNGTEIISISLTEGKYYKIYKIPTGFSTAWYAESYEVLTQ
jgi:hypothetical protein